MSFSFVSYITFLVHILMSNRHLAPTTCCVNKNHRQNHRIPEYPVPRTMLFTSTVHSADLWKKPCKVAFLTVSQDNNQHTDWETTLYNLSVAQAVTCISQEWCCLSSCLEIPT